jgi:3'-5' exoribonuclease
MNTIELIKKQTKGEMGVSTVAIVDAVVRQTKSKTPKDYLTLTLQDKTGTVKAKVWDWAGDAPPAGTIWKIKFELDFWNDTPQLVVRDFRELPRENVDEGLFLPSLTPEEFAHYHKMFNELLAKIKDAPLRKFVKWTLGTYYPTFFTATGAKANHHARLGGLLEHTCHVTAGALALAESYKETPKYDLIDMDLLIAGALLHDLAKIDTYTTENLVLDYSVQGQLVSDYDLSPAYLREAYIVADKPISEMRMLGLQHILVSHHGKEYSNKPPSTFSAWLVHAADISDAYTDKIATNIPEEDEVMSRESNWSFGNKIFDERKLA